MERGHLRKWAVVSLVARDRTRNHHGQRGRAHATRLPKKLKPSDSQAVASSLT